MTDEEKLALTYLNERLSTAVKQTIARWNKPFSEIRLRRDGPLSITLCSDVSEYSCKNLLCGVTCCADDMGQVVDLLCSGSLYSHSESICEGVIVTDSGIRAGISGRAVMLDGKIVCVREISSVNIRIPHRIKGAADELYSIVKKYGSTLLCSQPGMGKTTMLRELIPLLSEGITASKVSVIDSRFELGACISRNGLCDFYSGWPRYDGIMAAVRTMSPDYIICDEIADERDTTAVATASASGVKIIASAHGNSIKGIKRNTNLERLLERGVFSCVCMINKGSLEILEAFE